MPPWSFVSFEMHLPLVPVASTPPHHEFVRTDPPEKACGRREWYRFPKTIGQQHRCRGKGQQHAHMSESKMNATTQLETLSNKIADAIVDLVNTTDGPVTLLQVDREVRGFATYFSGLVLRDSRGRPRCLPMGRND
jgi:hypothetical protein